MPPRLRRSCLTVPGDDERKLAKAAQLRPDEVILDLEDAVAPDRKAAAREALTTVPLDPAITIVRLNAASTAEFDADLAALAVTGYGRVMLAKAETTAALDALAAYRVVALCESPLGVENAALLAAAPNVDALMWGAEDLVAALGGSGSRRDDGRYRDVTRYARARVLLAAGAAGKAAIDAVHLDLSDDAGLAEEAVDAAASGFVGTACIHPRQVPIVRAAFRPTPEALAWAERVLAAAEGADGVFTLDGRMIDEPLLRQARQVLAARRAG
jgi:citrate lyase subunit beta/citryl-CoA lyase